MQLPHQVSGGHFAVVIGLEFDPFTLQPFTQAVVIGQGTVVHQAQVQPGGKRMRMLGGNRTFRRHSGVSQGVAALKVMQGKALHELPWRSFFLVDFYRTAGAHNPQIGAVRIQPDSEFR